MQAVFKIIIVVIFYTKLVKAVLCFFVCNVTPINIIANISGFIFIGRQRYNLCFVLVSFIKWAWKYYMGFNSSKTCHNVQKSNSGCLLLLSLGMSELFTHPTAVFRFTCHSSHRLKHITMLVIKIVILKNHVGLYLFNSTGFKTKI